MPLSIKKLEGLLPFVQKPGRYLGLEKNRVVKKFSKKRLNIVLGYPDLYEIGMSNFSLKILYEIINRHNELWAQRVFLPDTDMQEILLSQDIELFSLESRHFITEFDILGVTIQTELNFIHFLQMLRLSHIPLYSSKRKGFPLVIAGGPGLVNPKPLASFTDFFFIGETEDILVPVLKKILEWKKKGLGRHEILQRVDQYPYIYVPSLKGKKSIKYAVLDLNKTYHPMKPPVPFLSAVHDRGVIEVSRGCLQGCRFCQAGYFYRPYRERDPEKILAVAKKLYKHTGYDVYTLLSLNITDYSRLQVLLNQLNDHFAPYHVSFALPSLRINEFTLNLLDSIKCIRKSGLTFALETADEVLQKGINKPINSDKFITTILTVAKKGWKRIKIYLIYGFSHDDQEIFALKKLMDKTIDALKKNRLYIKMTLHFNPLYKKPLTVLEQESQIPMAKIQQKLNMIKEIFLAKNYKTWIDLKWQDLQSAFLTMVLARGDERLSEVMLHVLQTSKTIPSDSQAYHVETWMPAFKGSNLDPGTFLSQKKDQISDDIDYGFRKDFFTEEHWHFRNAVTTLNCIKHKCYNCGICKGKIKNILARDIKSHKPKKSTSRNDRHYRYKLIFEKKGLMKFISHRDILDYFNRLFRMAGLSLRYSKGYNPRPKISISFSLPLIVEGTNEFVEFYTCRPVRTGKTVEKMNHILNNPFFRIKTIIPLSAGDEKSLSKIQHSEYRIATNDKTLINKLRSSEGYRSDVRGGVKIWVVRDRSVLKLLERLTGDKFPHLWKKVLRITRTNFC
ncbi:MAG: DUF2344 domain-containing protein [Spirochaetes bacterium]|nr:DUF2344 domain-containing protein [Spirochaetota bacterium]